MSLVARASNDCLHTRWVRTVDDVTGRLSSMAAWVGIALYLLDLTIKVIALGVIPKNRRPSSGMAWLLLIMIIPFLGFIIFLVLGRTKLERRRSCTRSSSALTTTSR